MRNGIDLHVKPLSPVERARATALISWLRKRRPMGKSELLVLRYESTVRELADALGEACEEVEDQGIDASRWRAILRGTR